MARRARARRRRGAARPTAGSSPGAALEAGGSAEAALGDLAAGRRYSVQFWDANATKALHVGHLRNLAIGNAIAAALTQAGGQVERRSLISDAGRSMGEAMAGRRAERAPRARLERRRREERSLRRRLLRRLRRRRRRVAGGEARAPRTPRPASSRCSHDDADELLGRVLEGDHEALELWYKTRAWVIAGQRKTLARLGVAFDRVFFESDFLVDATELTSRRTARRPLQAPRGRRGGLRDGLEELRGVPARAPRRRPHPAHAGPGLLDGAPPTSRT